MLLNPETGDSSWATDEGKKMMIHCAVLFVGVKGYPGYPGSPGRLGPKGFSGMAGLPGLDGNAVCITNSIYCCCF